MHCDKRIFVKPFADKPGMMDGRCVLRPDHDGPCDYRLSSGKSVIGMYRIQGGLGSPYRVTLIAR